MVSLAYELFTTRLEPALVRKGGNRAREQRDPLSGAGRAEARPKGSGRRTGLKHRTWLRAVCKKPTLKIGQHKLAKSARTKKYVHRDITTQKKAEVVTLVSDKSDFKKKKKEYYWGDRRTLHNKVVRSSKRQQSCLCVYLTKLQSTWSRKCLDKNKR